MLQVILDVMIKKDVEVVTKEVIEGAIKEIADKTNNDAVYLGQPTQGSDGGYETIL